MSEETAVKTSKLRLMKCGYGDKLLAEWMPERTESVENARMEFLREFNLGGRMAFRIDGPGQSVPIKEFQETANEILIVPAVVGG